MILERARKASRITTMATHMATPLAPITPGGAASIVIGTAVVLGVSVANGTKSGDIESKGPSSSLRKRESAKTINTSCNQSFDGSTGDMKWSANVVNMHQGCSEAHHRHVSQSAAHVSEADERRRAQAVVKRYASSEHMDQRAQQCNAVNADE
jgi:hypothetical protein